MERRRFLAAIGSVPAIGVLSPTSLLAEPRFKISLAQWSLHRRLRGGQKPRLDNLDFALTARELGIDAIEYVNSFFKKHAKDKAYLGKMKKRAADVGVKSLLIMVDGEGRLGEVKKKGRAKAVDNHKSWVDAAHFLGCHSIRVNAASSGKPDEQRKLVVDGLSQLTAYAKTAGLNVIVENHGGLSSNGAWLASVMKAVNDPRCGTLPDFGNFRLGGGKEYDRYKGVKELMPYAKAVSAKSHDFDKKGEETRTDYKRMLKIVYDAGYRGYIGIEYEGGKISEMAGIRATQRLLERYRL